MNQLHRAILVNVIPHEIGRDEAMRDFDELVRLVETYGGIVILKILQKRGRPSAKTFLGEGKAQEIANLAKGLKADMVIINDFLKANQSNNLVNIIPCEVLDRFELILMIFEKHAASPEAKLQIELMRLKYEFPKLFGRKAFLAQQKGGVRAMGGPGEKILEYKRRHLKNHIYSLEEKLNHFRKIRQEQRLRRKRKNFFTVSLVGYTNSGKSTVLKALTKKEVKIENKLFSTLDTRLGKLYWPSATNNYAEAPQILISDTIGFMQKLPPLLFQTFLATLEEVSEANLLLHIIDASDSRVEEKMQVVENILKELGCGDKPRINVLNKTDLLDGNSALTKFKEKFSSNDCVFVSALLGENLDELKEKILRMV